MTAFLLDRDDEGLSFGEPVRKMGQRAIVNTEMFLSAASSPTTGGSAAKVRDSAG